MSILLERAALVSWDYYFKTRGKSGAKNSVSQKRIWELEGKKEAWDYGAEKGQLKDKQEKGPDIRPVNQVGNWAP